jgi:tRNA(fMet)-specific endonuclease VapC
MKMLDTNICSYLLAGKEPWTSQFEADGGGYVISSLVAYELEVWAAMPEISEAMAALIRAFLEGAHIVSFGQDAAAASAQVSAQLRNAGRSIGAIDPLIAGHAISKNAILITNNEKDFKGITGLRYAAKL